jgi:hypothetical protein
MKDVIEILSQPVIYIGKKDLKKNFWDVETNLKMVLPKWKKWQKLPESLEETHDLEVLQPRVSPQLEDVTVEEIREQNRLSTAGCDV